MVLQVDRQCGIGWALVDQPSLENRVQVGAARRLHQSPPRHRRGAKSGAAAAAARGDGAVYRGNNHRTVALAALAACHRLRVASPEALQCLGWRDWALPGAPP